MLSVMIPLFPEQLTYELTLQEVCAGPQPDVTCSSPRINHSRFA
jgi:hypothetical protein